MTDVTILTENKRPGGSTQEVLLNLGPQHPSTHGVLRLVLEMEGEIVSRIDPFIGYLHRGTEKLAESFTYTQIFPLTDRLDYVCPPSNNLGYAMAVEKLLGIEAPVRAQYIRVRMAELARISAARTGQRITRAVHLAICWLVARAWLSMLSAWLATSSCSRTALTKRL